MRITMGDKVRNPGSKSFLDLESRSGASRGVQPDPPLEYPIELDLGALDAQGVTLCAIYYSLPLGTPVAN